LATLFLNGEKWKSWPFRKIIRVFTGRRKGEKEPTQLTPVHPRDQKAISKESFQKAQLEMEDLLEVELTEGRLGLLFQGF